MPPAERPLPLAHALALGLLQGPTELLPVSSSAHTTLLPWLAGWPYAGLDGESRKTFEVALHAGAGVALTLALRGELFEPRAPAGVLALSLAPPSLVGLLWGRAIERRLGGPRSIAAGLLAGALLMALADARPPDGRPLGRAHARDGLALGLAQALALAPGISRSGATLAAARALGFARADAARLSWQAALPVIVGASALQGARQLRRPAPARPALLAGAAGSFLSTLAAARLLAGGWRRGRRLLGYSIYRSALAALVAARLRRPPRAR
jgi:undecaprenyl-diphosphatase